MHETLLLFGATGDLVQRYLFPSLANLLRDRLLPPDFRVIAVPIPPYPAGSSGPQEATAFLPGIALLRERNQRNRGIGE